MAAFMGARCVLCTIVGEAFKAACTGAWGSVLGAICILLGSGVVDAVSEKSLSDKTHIFVPRPLPPALAPRSILKVRQHLSHAIQKSTIILAVLIDRAAAGRALALVLPAGVDLLLLRVLVRRLRNRGGHLARVDATVVAAVAGHALAHTACCRLPCRCAVQTELLDIFRQRHQTPLQRDKIIGLLHCGGATLLAKHAAGRPVANTARRPEGYAGRG